MVLHVKDGKKFFDEQLLLHIEHKRYDEMVSIIKEEDVRSLVDSSGMTLLHHAVVARNYGAVTYLIRKKCKVDIMDLQGNTPLMLAVMSDHEFITDRLLDAQANVFACNQENQTPMSVALTSQLVCNPRIIYKFLEILRKECSADSRRMATMFINIKCPLPRVMYLEDVAITEYMLDDGCTVHDRDPRNGFTALHYAVQYHDFNNIKLLLERGADVNAEDSSRKMPIHLYQPPDIDGNHEILTSLWEHGAVLDTHNEHGHNVAANVLHLGDVDEVKALLQFNIDFNAQDERGINLLSYVVRNINVEVINLLEGREFDVNAVDNQQRPAIWHAVCFINPYAVQFLLKNDAKPNDGLDSLSDGILRFEAPEEYFSVNRSRIICLELLLQFGLDLFTVDANQRTIFDIAIGDENVKLLNPVLERVAMMIAQGKTLNETFLAQIRSNDKLQKYFNECQKAVEAFKDTVVQKPVTLYNFLAESDEQLLKYARNAETVEKLQVIMQGLRIPKFRLIEYFIRKRIEDTIKIAELRKQASVKIAKIVELQCNGCIIDNIVMFLDKEALENMSQI